MGNSRTIYVVVNTESSVGVADWRDDAAKLPAYGFGDQRYIVTVPAMVAGDHRAITQAMDAFLGGYDLPDGWLQSPVGGCDG